MLLGMGAGEGPWATGYVLPSDNQPLGPVTTTGYEINPADVEQAKKTDAARKIIAVTTAVKKAAAAPAAAATSALASFPWLKAGLIGAGVIGAVVLLSAHSGRQRRKNPDDEDDDGDGDEDDDGVDRNPRRAFDFFREFYWGREPGRVRRTKVSPLPRELVQLGTLEAITYSAKKGGEKLADYIHHFGEEGHRKPKLAADPRNKKLHIIGGDYGVEAAGIVR